MDELPLLELFTRLREAGLPLGIPDYEAVVQALQKGYGLPDRAALARLCQTLWVRSTDERQLFDYYFEQFFGLPQREITDETEIRKILKSIAITDPQQIRHRNLQVWEVTHAVFRTLGYAFLFAGLGLGASLTIRGVQTQLTQPTNIPADVTHILRTTTTQPSPTSLPSPSKPSSTPQPIKLPRTKEQTARVEQWRRINQLISQATESFWQLTALLVGGALIVGGLWLFRAFLQRPPKPINPLEPDSQRQRSRITPRQTQPQMVQEIKDKVQAAQIIRQVMHQSVSQAGNRSRLLVFHDYLPVTQRQMKQSWRHLRRMVREGLATELDVEATVHRIAHDGMLLHPVLVARRTNRTELVLLIDQDGSMVPFHSLSARLVETALRGGRLGKAGAYYFHNCPVDYLYNDPMHQEAEPIEEVLRGFQRDRTAVLIFSDAGAARGGLNPERADLTVTFLQQLKQHVRYVAWLNPMPKPRWTTSTAKEIALHVPMFEATRQGLDEAIDALRGRHHALAALLGGQK